MTTMNVVYKFNILVLLVSSLLLASCGNPRKPSSESGISEVTYMESASLNEGELSVAKRICYSYRSKRSNLKSNYHNKTFSFNIYQKDCAKNELSKNLNMILNAPTSAQTLTWMPASQEDTFDFITNIQDSDSGYIKQVCDKVFRGEKVSNSITMGGTQTVQIQFSRSNIDQYRLNYFSELNGVQTLMSSDVFRVRTQFDFTAGQILGFDEEIIRYKKCENSDDFLENTHKLSKLPN